MQTATLGLLLGWCCCGCGKSALESSAPVPPDCQQFLVKYFEAIKAKDVGTIQNLSSCITREATKGMPETSMKMLHESQRKITAEGFERMARELGDFRNYSVLSVNVTTQKADTVAANMMGAGIHATIVCRTKFAKQSSVRLGLHLFKETPEAEYSILAWKYETGL